MNDIATPAAPAQPARRLRYIDALRGIAALLVLWLHVANSFRVASVETATHAHWLNDFVSEIDIGRIGVVVFFLISGFVIPFSIKPRSGAPVAGFAIRRVFRIYPAYWLSVPLAGLVFYWLPGYPFSARDVLVNLTLLQDVVGVPPAEGLYWTLLVELVFYALCIGLLLTRSLFVARRIALLCLALTLAHVAAMFLLWLKHPLIGAGAAFWLVNLAVMLWGTLYRLATTAPTRDRFVSIALWSLAAFYLVALPIGAALAIDSLHNYSVAYALGLFVFLVGTRFVRIETRLTDWLGRISYSIYLFHPIVFQTAWLWLVRQPVDSAWRTQNLAVYLLANLVATLAVAALVFRFVERPAIRLGHRLASRREARAASPLRDATGDVGAEPIAG